MDPDHSEEEKGESKGEEWKHLSQTQVEELLSDELRDNPEDQRR